MCSQHDDSGRSTQKGTTVSDGVVVNNGPPDWENINLPPDHVLSHLTDAHCHPTDLTHLPKIYDNVKLGGLASMATIVGDQDRVRSLSEERGWYRGSFDATGEEAGSAIGKKGKGKDGKGVGVVACFGYHPWFTHLYTLSSPSTPSTKEDHYFSLFSPTSEKNKNLLNTLLPYLPEPKPFQPLLDKLKEDIQRSLGDGRLTMLGEVGLDGSARMRWPREARHLHPDYQSNLKNEEDTDQPQRSDEAGNDNRAEESDEDWKRLTPFKVPMSHQRAIVEQQVDLAVELGVNVSLHSVACAGPSLDTLISMRNKHGVRFTNRINVDLHSAGGWSPDFWKQAERNLRNLYASPSIFITGRSPSASALISAISKDRLLVESDSHDVRLSSQLVWAATEWISRCKGWNLEGKDQHPDDKGDQVAQWEFDEDDDAEDEDERKDVDKNGRLKKRRSTKLENEDVWTVRTLERNWLRFMGLIED